MTHIRLWITWRLASHTNPRDIRLEKRRTRERGSEGSEIGHSYQSEAGCSAPALGTPWPTTGRLVQRADALTNCNSLSDSHGRKSPLYDRFAQFFRHADWNSISARGARALMRGLFDGERKMRLNDQMDRKYCRLYRTSLLQPLSLS